MKRVWWMAVFLGAQIAVFYGYPPIENQLLARPLSSLPQTMGDWQMVGEVPLSESELEVLKADDTVNRYYSRAARSDQAAVNLMAAYFKSQRGAVAPHSPKVCLLGGGWFPTQSGTLSISLSSGRQITVNRYVLTKDGHETLLLYWFAPQRRIFASEYAVKLDTLVRSLVRHRNDTSFVRVIMPIAPGLADESERVVTAFVQANFERINTMFPE